MDIRNINIWKAKPLRVPEPRVWSDKEIAFRYKNGDTRTKRARKQMIQILADLNAVSPEYIINALKRQGINVDIKD